MNNATKRLLSLVIVLAMALALLPVISFAAGTTTTVYCKTAASWTGCKAYWWGSTTGSNPSWPGNDMTADANGIWTIDVPSDAVGLIFTNGTGSQTANLTVPTDGNVMYTYTTASWGPYDAAELELAYYVAGSMNGWTNPDAAYKMEKQADGTYALTLTLTAGSYELKVTDGTWDNSWGEAGSTKNYKFTAPEDGEYVVTFDGSVVNVEGGAGPEPMVIEYVAVVGDEALTGVNWDVEDESTAMDQDGSVYTLTLNNVAAGTYEFKFAANGSWDIQWASGDEMVSGETYTAWFAPMGNSKLNITSEGATVTLTLDLTNMDPISGEGASCSVIIEGGEPVDPVDPPVTETAYYVAGTMNGWTNPDEACKMTKLDDGTYALTLTLTAGEYAFKVTNGTWDDGCNWGKDGQDYVFVLEADGEVTITFDGVGTVGLIGAEEPEPEPIVIESMYIAGSAGLIGVEWDPSFAVMTAEGSVYTITFTGVAAGAYEYKFVSNGAWGNEWASGIEAENGVEQDAWYKPMGNSTLTVAEDNSTVTMVLDLTNMDPITGNGGKTTVTIEVPVSGVAVTGTATTGAEGDTTIELIADGEVVATATASGKTGTYAFENIAAGTYTVKVSKLNHATREYELVVGTEAAALDVKIHLIGDITGDGRVNVGDVSRAYAYSKKTGELNEYEFACADVTGDGRVNVGDVSRIYGHSKKTSSLW